MTDSHLPLESLPRRAGPGVSLTLDGVCRVVGDRPVLRDLSLALGGEPLTTLVGPHGAGKSTLLRVIAGGVPVTRGRIALDGVPLGGRSTSDLERHGLVHCAEVPPWPPGASVSELLRLAATTAALGRPWPALGLRGRDRARAEREQTDRLLALAGRSALANRPADALPHGEQKLVTILRALSRRPRLLLVDEPLAGLPNGLIADMTSLLVAIGRRLAIPVVVVERDLGWALRWSDRLVVLAGGRVMADGPPRRVRDEGGLIDSGLEAVTA